MARHIRKSDADIIHANYIRSPAYASFLSGKRPYVLSSHGDDVRYGTNLFGRISMWRAAKIFCSTKDLLPKVKNGILLSRPVDPRFHPLGKPKDRKALYFEQTTSDPRTRSGEAEYVKWITSYCETEGYDLTRKAKRDIHYSEMPEFLSQFSLVFDLNFPEYSKIALEARAMGIPVLPDKHDDEDHNPQNIAKFLKSEYEMVLKK
jgi:hypothetical protein